MEPCLCNVIANSGHPKSKRTSVQSLHENLINYLNLNQNDNIVTGLVPGSAKKSLNYIDSKFQRADLNDEECSSKASSYFTDYFFKVYSDDGNVISQEKITDMVKFHVTRNERPDSIEHSSAFNKCKSENVKIEKTLIPKF